MELWLPVIAVCVMLVFFAYTFIRAWLGRDDRKEKVRRQIRARRKIGNKPDHNTSDTNPSIISGA